MRSVLRSIYGDVLSRAEVADEDNFFALGGDSLSAVRIAALVGDRLGIGIDFVEVLNHPTVGLLDTALSGRPAPAPADTSHPDLASPVQQSASLLQHGGCPASPVQQSLYALHRLAGQHAVVEPIVIRLPGRRDADRVAAAFDSLLERHQVLRTTFAVDPVDGLRATVREVPDAFVHCPSAGSWSAADLGAVYRDALREPFDVERGPLVRLRLLTGAEPVSHLLLSCHHLVSDGLTAMTIEDELRTHYRGAAPPSAEQYADYAQWLHRWCASEAADAARAFWRATLAGCQPGAELPANNGTFATVRHDRLLDADTAQAVRAASARHGVSVAVFLQACLRAAWTALSGQSDVVLGVAASTRPNGRSVGPYVNTLPVRTTSTASEPFVELLRRTDLANRSALGHRLLPIEYLQADIADGQSLFEIGFTHQRMREVPGLLAVIGERAVAEPLGIPLLVVVYETPAELRIRLRYRPSVIAAELPDRLWATMTRVLAEACSMRQGTAALAGRSTETFDLNLDD